MNIHSGYALLRDRRVSVRSKLIALTLGLAFTGLVELLQLPFESVFALLAPVAGAACDIVIDGAEAVIIPVLVATVLMPYLAPSAIVQQLRAERAARFIGLTQEYSSATMRFEVDGANSIIRHRFGQQCSG
jgi:hypothetical protein